MRVLVKEGYFDHSGSDKETYPETNHDTLADWFSSVKKAELFKSAERVNEKAAEDRKIFEDSGLTDEELDDVVKPYTFISYLKIYSDGTWESDWKK